MQETVKIVMFAGGRGASSISEAISRNPQLSLTLLINGYDDGLSTGRLRHFIPSMLGPSDFRKNAHGLIHQTDICDNALSELLNFRFPKRTTEQQAYSFFRFISNPKIKCDVNYSATTLNQLSVGQQNNIGQAIKCFIAYYEKNKSIREFSFGDCAIGNIVFGGYFLNCGENFNEAVNLYSKLCCANGQLLNVTDGRPLILCALKANGEILIDEASIVSPQNSIPIKDIYLLKDYLTKQETEELEHLNSIHDKAAWLQQKHVTPEPNLVALETLKSADIIIYGPGTQHSSLFPSYLTNGIAESINENLRAEKIFISNITQDHDIKSNSVNDLIDLLFYFISRKSSIDLQNKGVLSTVFVQNQREQSSGISFEPLPFVDNDFGKEISTSVRDWTFDDRSHSGEYVLKEIISMAARMVDFQIQPNRNLISIVVPTLNEKNKIGKVLSKLERQLLPWADIHKEIIVIDGGSDDGTLSEAQRFRGVRTYSLNSQNKEKGRGAAFMYGVKNARGSIIVMFPSDDEYDTSDIIDLVKPIIENKFRFVIGSRAIKCQSLNQQIRDIYGKGNLFSFIIGKYGGILVSITSLLLFNRFVTDPFSTLRAYDANLLKEINPIRTGVDMDAEIIAKACLKGEYIMEIPVNFKPRQRIDGKKIVLKDGLATIWTLLRHRYQRSAN